MSTTTAVAAAPALSVANKVGLAVAGLLGVVDVVANLPMNAPEGDQVGPPLGILVVDMVLGAITVVAVVWAFRTGIRAAVRLAAGARILSVVTALPAFFVDVPPVLKALVAAFTLLTFAAVVLMLRPVRRTTSVTD